MYEWHVRCLVKSNSPIGVRLQFQLVDQSASAPPRFPFQSPADLAANFF